MQRVWFALKGQVMTLTIDLKKYDGMAQMTMFDFFEYLYSTGFKRNDNITITVLKSGVLQCEQ